jgi:hypothetical protein
MQTLGKRLKKEVAWVAAEHDDHAPNRHVHVVAVVKRRLHPRDFQVMRQRATEAALFQRKQRKSLLILNRSCNGLEKVV